MKKSRFSFLFFLTAILALMNTFNTVGQKEGEETLVESRFKLSSQAELSVITCGPGTDELYASFGHSAFRVLDIPNKIDRVYNYGTFDFNTPNFYTKFAQGKLLYQLSAYDFGRFLQSYHLENRWVKGQVLDLTHEEVQQVFDFLENNALPENRSYKYDFFYDNCSTKLYEVLEKVLGDRLIFDNEFEKDELSHRDLISLYTQNQPWADFGIDLALGADIDREATAKEYMFLPDYVFEAFKCIEIAEAMDDDPIVSGEDPLAAKGERKPEAEPASGSQDGSLESSAKSSAAEANSEDDPRVVNSKPIVKRTEEILLNYKEEKENESLTPLQAGGIFLLVILFVTFLDHRKGRRSRIFDGILMISTGLTGVILLLLWFATDHTATVNNFNILWAFAPNLLFAFILQRKPRVSFWYFFTLLLLLDVLVGLWIFQVQVFHMAMIPILAGLYVRYVFLWRYFSKWRNLGVNAASNSTEASETVGTTSN